MTISVNGFEDGERVNCLIGGNFHIIPMNQTTFGGSSFICSPVFWNVNAINSSVAELNPFFTRFLSDNF